MSTKYSLSYNYKDFYRQWTENFLQSVRKFYLTMNLKIVVRDRILFLLQNFDTLMYHIGEGDVRYITGVLLS